MKLSRRAAIRGGAGALGLATLAGCLSEPGDDTDDAGSETGETDRSGYAAFFAIWDWSTEIVGEQLFENPVDAGEMGHGWSPDGDLTRDVASTDVFVYLDSPEFAWAQDLAAQLEDEADGDVEIIDGMADFTEEQLLAFSDGAIPEPDNDHDFDPESLTVDGFDVIDPTSGEVAAYWHDGHWHGGVPEVPVDGSITLEAVFEADGDHVVPLGDDQDFQFDARLDDGAPEDHVEIESHGDSLELHGLEAGRTLIVFELRHGDEVLWDTSADTMNLDVSEDVDPAEVTEFHDPHVWVDPVLASDVVDTLTAGLADVWPEHADEFEENAEAYQSRLEEVDTAFEQAVDDGALDIAVFAGHDSFRYVENRYDFDLHSPVGVSPDESPSPDEIADTIELVNEEGIDTILYDPFEAPDGDVPPLAETIVEDSDATETAPLTPAEGTMPEWSDNDWGWVEQMEEITLPSLRQALQAEEP